MESNIQFGDPRDLAEKLLIYRNELSKWPSGSLVSLDKEALCHILILCYRVSLQREEGRNIRLQLCVTSGKESENAKRIITIDPPCPLDEETLRRLAPSTLIPTHALRVYWDEKELLCDGIISLASVDYPGDFLLPPRPFRIFTHLVPDLVIQVQGPGRICVTHRDSSWYLRDCQIQNLNEFSKISIVKQHLQSFTNELSNKAQIDFGNDFADWMKTSNIDGVFPYFCYFFGEILSEAIEAQHGGTFVVLPHDDSICGISPGNKANGIDLDKELIEFFHVYFSLFERIPRASFSNENDFRESIENFLRKQESLHLKLKSLACLANIDGCVVLSHHLRLVAFGAKISPPFSLPVKKCFKVSDDGHIEEFDITRNLGTRHQSAYRLCAFRPGISAYVISQDGKLRIFFGLEDKVVFAEATATAVPPHALRR